MVDIDLVLNRYKEEGSRGPSVSQRGRGETSLGLIFRLPLKVIMGKNKRTDILTPTALPWEREKLLLEDYTTYKKSGQRDSLEQMPRGG